MRRFTTLLLLGLFVLLASHWTNAQNYYYGPNGRTVLDISTEQAVVKFHTWVARDRLSRIFEEIPGMAPFDPDWMLPAPDVVLARLENGHTPEQVHDILARLKQLPEVAYANHLLMHKDGTAHGITDRLLARLHPGSDPALLSSTAALLGARIEERTAFDPRLYVLTVTNPLTNALKVANALHETGLFDYAEPDLLRLMKRMNTSDPFVDDQWALHNDGSNTSAYGGTPGADMKVFDAWVSTTGTPTIKVAILDEGVDLNHPDLAGNLLPGYDATGRGSEGGPEGDDAHGTACAGIVAAIGNNNMGVAGIAYNCKIIPVRIAYSNAQGNWVTTTAMIADAINWAWQNGADILSNSWGGGSPSSTINNAIDNAINNGRGGLGSPVLFAAGNNNLSSASYPASYEPTIAVIAMSMCNQRKNPSSCDGETWWGSNYGAGADVAAPGVKIYATDISGAAGYSTGDYIPNFNGTSSACPNAAGVMALILSTNPGLSISQARYALESTCDKVGNYSYTTAPSQPNGAWSNDLGYGLINARTAVNSVAPTQNDDAAISAVLSPRGLICSPSATPTVVLYNAGANAITSVMIHYQVDGGTVNTQAWTGTLASLTSTQVNLPDISFTGGAHTFTAYTSSPNGVNDSRPDNDETTSSFTYGDHPIELTIVLDNYPQETSWDVKDETGNILAFGGTYADRPDGSTVVESMCLPEGCFNFTIYDSYGDGICCTFGEGSYTLVDQSTGVVLASGGQFLLMETTPFCLESGDQPLAVQISTTDVSCKGGSDGVATATPTGGMPPYSFKWSTDETSASISGLFAGTYHLTVTDQNSEQIITAATINEPAVLTLNTSATAVTCGATADGTVTATASGGTPSFSYRWTDAGGAEVGAEGTLTSLAAGAYYVTATDANGCFATGSAIVSDPNATYYADADLDTYGNPNVSIRACSPPPGYVVDNTDCDDTDETIYPGAVEKCDGLDNNCDGNADEGLTDCNPCLPVSTAFSVTPLTHSGAGSSTALVSYDGPHRDVSFTISNINQKDNGAPNTRYIEIVTVSYVDGAGISHDDYLTFHGASSSTESVVLPGEVLSITITLYDGLDGDAGSTMSVDLSDVSSCSTGETCPDSDGDGVCDAADLCPGFDDHTDTDGDGIPDGCDTSDGCVTATDNFPVASLEHSGSGSAAATLTFTDIRTDVSFTVSSIDTKLNGTPTRFYIEEVTVAYENGTAETPDPIRLNGNEGSSLPVYIPGNVTSVTVTLTDIYDDGVTASTIRVDLSPVTSCLASGSAAAISLPFLPGTENSVEADYTTISLFPNPATDQLTVRYGLPEAAEVRLQVTDLNGRILLLQQQLLEAGRQESRIATQELPGGIYLLHLLQGDEHRVRRFVIVR